MNESLNKRLQRSAIGIKELKESLAVSMADEEIMEKMAIDNARLRKLLEEAIEFADEGWGYASEYFKDKWNYEKTSKRLNDALKEI